MFSAKNFSRRGRNKLNFIQTRNLLLRKPQPRSSVGAFAACPGRLFQTRRNRRGRFRRQSRGFEVRRRHKKILGEHCRVRFEGYDTSRKRFKFRGKRIAQTLKAKRNFGPHRLPSVRSFSPQVQRVGQNRRDPTDVFAQMNAFWSSSLQPRPPVPAARQNLKFGIRLAI